MKSVPLIPLKTTIIFLFPVLASPLLAQETAPRQNIVRDSTYYLDNITVTGSAMPIALRKLASSVSILKANDPEMQQIRSLDEALQYIPGVYVSRARGLSTTGGHTTVTMRGTEASNRTLILKDGIPVNDAYTGGVGVWNTTATNSISRIEVVRGPGSSIYGSNSMGGTINLVTEDPAPSPTLGAHFRYGSLNTAIMGLKAGKAFQNGFGIIAFAEYKKTDGYQYVADSLWEGYYRKPSNDLFNLNTKLSYRFNPDSKLEAIVDYHLEKPLTGTSTSYKSDYKTDNYLLRYSGSSHMIDYNVSAYYNRQRRSTNAMRYDAGSGQFDINYYDSEIPIAAYGLVGKVNKTFGRNSVTIGADLRFTRINSKRHTYEKGDQNFSGDQNFLSFFINDEISLGESMNLNVGLRYDNWQNVNGKFYDNATGEEIRINYDHESSEVLSPKVGLVYNLSDQFRLRSTYAMGFKAPNSYYMYNSAPLGSSFRLGNSDLGPERMTYSIDLGADFYLNEKLEASATWYVSSFSDFIDNVLIDAGEVPAYFDPGGLPVRQYINIGKVNLRGLETSVKYRFLPHTTAIASYFYNRSRIIRYESNPDYEGNELEDSPAFLLNCGLDYRNEKALNASIWIRHTGEYFADMENTAAYMVAPSTVVDIKLSKRINKLTFSANVLNVFDELFLGSYTSPRSYYYAPPRTVDFGISYNL